MKRRSVLGVIPARGGSKGIPRKNILPLAGKPLVVHTIEAARAARTLTRVLVSTDDEEIAAVARAAGAEVPFLRPAELATDTAPSIGPVKHALAWLERHEGVVPEAVAVLAPTSPLRGAEPIDGTVTRMWASGLASASTVREVVDHPYYVFREAPDGRLVELLGLPNKPLRRQDLPTYFGLTQAVLVARAERIRAAGDEDPILDFGSCAAYPIDAVSAIDIDTPDDFALAEALMTSRLTAPLAEVAP